jgi:UDP-3-O-[3-hydroxymyristoyl] glucosamine N-acyltransferase
MPVFTLKKIAEMLEGELEGRDDLAIHCVRTLEESEPGSLSVVLNRRSIPAEMAPDRALVVPNLVRAAGCNVVRVSDPRGALIALLRLFYPEQPRRPSVDPRAMVSPQAVLGAGVSVGAGACIEGGVRIGDGAQVYPNVYIGEEATIGDQCELFPGVTVYPRCRIGKRVRIHSGAVIGSDGFGYARDEAGVYRKIPQTGWVEIGDDVEIGANCTIDRATLGATRVGSGTKIDNLVQVGHNASIGTNCCIIAQVGISGSVRIGDSSVLAGQVGISDHVNLAEGVVVGAQSGVMRDLDSGEWLGYPAIPAPEARRAYPLIARLPEMRRELRELKRRCDELERLLREGPGPAKPEHAPGED